MYHLPWIPHLPLDLELYSRAAQVQEAASDSEDSEDQENLQSDSSPS